MAITTGTYDPHCPMCGYLKTHCECEGHYYYNDGEVWRWSGEHTYKAPDNEYGNRVNEYAEYHAELYQYAFEACLCCEGMNEKQCRIAMSTGKCPLMEVANGSD